jgi:hypothetical protein
MPSEQLDKKVLTMPGSKHGVHIGSDGAVDNETVNLSKQAGDEIVWQSNGEAFSIYFPVSPFGRQTGQQRFEVMRGGEVSSGPVRPDAGVGYYPYYITIVRSGASTDPGVDVKP